MRQHIQWIIVPLVAIGLIVVATSVTQAQQDQSSEGEAVYNDECAQCHEQGGAGPQLTASSLAGYNTAEGLFSYISQAMPLDEPGSLPEEQYWDVTAYLLASRGLISNDETVGPGTAEDINLEPGRQQDGSPTPEEAQTGVTPTPGQEESEAGATPTPGEETEATPAGTVSVDDVDMALAGQLWQTLQEARYTENWVTVPGKGTFYPGQPPHGALLSTYMNPAAAEALMTRPGQVPGGAIIVKENYTANRELNSITVMEKRAGHGDPYAYWFWARYGPDGAVQDSGLVEGCIACHGAVRSNDYIFSFPVMVFEPGATTATPILDAPTSGQAPQATPPAPEVGQQQIPEAEEEQMPAAAQEQTPEAEEQQTQEAEEDQAPETEQGYSVAAVATPGGTLPTDFEVQLVKVTDGLIDPINVVSPRDGSGRLFVVERHGVIQVVQDGRVLDEPFLDISDQVLSAFLEQGMYDLEFDPDFTNNGYFYVHFAELMRNGDSMIVRYQVSDDNPNVANPDSARGILQIDQPWANHNGGELAFGPDGYLYIGSGDGGWEGDPLEAGQDLSTLLGKILRIDVNVEGDRPYAIPEDNPFVQSLQPVQLFGISEDEFAQIHTEARPEIWAYGLRNSWKFNFDPETGDLYHPDVGQNHWEEINFQPADSPGGENYGWDLLMGSHCFPVQQAECVQVGVLPIAEYHHDVHGGCAVVGIGVYRGENQALDGVYFAGDYCSGKIWGIVRDEGDTWIMEELLDTDLQLTGAGQDENGELYVTSCNCNYGGPAPQDNPPGSLWRIVPVDQVPEGAETAPAGQQTPTPEMEQDTDQAEGTPAAEESQPTPSPTATGQAESTPTPQATSEATPTATETGQAEGTPAASPTTEANRISVLLTEYQIGLVPTLPAGPTVFEVRNAGMIPHNFEIEGQDIEQVFDTPLEPGEVRTMEVDLRPGAYTVYCPLDDHADLLGMTMELEVTEEQRPTQQDTSTPMPGSDATATPGATPERETGATSTPTLQGEEAEDDSPSPQQTASPTAEGNGKQALIDQGEQVFNSNCAVCHGQQGGGGSGPALAGNPFVMADNPSQVIDVVLHGRGGMPAWQDSLSTEQVAAVVSYIRDAWNNNASTVSVEQVEEQTQ